MFKVHCWDLVLREKKKIPLTILPFIDNALGHSSALMEMYSAIVLMPAIMKSILQPMDQGVISNCKSYYFLNLKCVRCIYVNLTSTQLTVLNK